MKNYHKSIVILAFFLYIRFFFNVKFHSKFHRKFSLGFQLVSFAFYVLEQLISHLFSFSSPFCARRALARRLHYIFIRRTKAKPSEASWQFVFFLFYFKFKLKFTILSCLFVQYIVLFRSILKKYFVEAFFFFREKRIKKIINLYFSHRPR